MRVGDELDVWWPLDNVYYPGVVTAVEKDGRHRIDYEDGDVERVYLRKERWKFRGEAAKRVMHALVPPKEAKSESPQSEADVAGSDAKEDGAVEGEDDEGDEESSLRSGRGAGVSGKSYAKVTKRRSAGGRNRRSTAIVK